MDYNIIDYMPDGVVVENLTTNEIIHFNDKAKDILHIKNENKFEFLKDIAYHKNTFSEFYNDIIAEFRKNDFARGVIRIKTFSNTMAEIDFDCVWFRKEDDLVAYIFKDVKEITEIGNKHLSFQEVTEFLPSGVSVMDLQSDIKVTYANEEHYKILGIEESKDEFNNLLKDSLYEEDKDWVMSEIYNSMHKGTDVDIEFRVKAKGNKLKWVRLYGRAKKSSSGDILFYSSLKDLSARREINDKLHLERILLRKITELTNEILFRLDLETNIIHFLGTQFTEIFGKNPVMENFPNCILDKNIVYEEDIPIIDNMFEAFREGVSKQVEIRLRMSNGDIVWHHILYSFVKSSENKPLLVIGKLIDIQKQKWLEEQARIDLLTGFYNKIHTETEVNKLLASSNSFDEHVLFIIDIDNFKGINDNMGHHFGDIVLHDIASDIRNCFRKRDILGRIGGDEFIVVMKDCNNQEMVIEKASMLCEVLEKTFAGKDKIYNISASIGIAKYPIDGVSYEKLYQTADLALYKTKDSGKNNFTIYSNELCTDKKITASQIHNSNRISNNISIIDSSVIATVFNLLYETHDMRLSLNTVLEYIANAYKVDRCYIFQTLDCGKIYRNDYQWERDKGIIKEEDVQYVNKKILTDIFSEADEDGVFYTDDIYKIKNREGIEILEHDEVVSIFLVESLKKSERKAFFGIEDCHKQRTWSERDVRTLFHVARIIFHSLTSYNIINRLEMKNNIENKIK